MFYQIKKKSVVINFVYETTKLEKISIARCYRHETLETRDDLNTLATCLKYDIDWDVIHCDLFLHLENKTDRSK